MSNSAHEIHATDAVPSIEDGDQAATNGEWQRAVDIWGRQLASGERSAAARRIRWFLAEATGKPIQSESSRTRQQAFVYLMVGVGCGLVGTALVLIGENRSGTSQDVLAAMAWTLYIATAVLAVIYAYKVGRSAEHTTPPLDPGEMARAVQLAASLGLASATPDSPSDHLPRVMRR